MTIAESGEVLKRLPQGLSREEVEATLKAVRRVVILRTSWYESIMGALTQSAEDYLLKAGVRKEAIEIVEIPGSFELPLAVLQLSQECVKPELVVALGCVVRGGTPHFDFVCNAVSNGLIDVQLRTSLPVGFGVLTVDTLEQAEARRDKGGEAAQAAVFMHLLSRSGSTLQRPNRKSIS